MTLAVQHLLSAICHILGNTHAVCGPLHFAIDTHNMLTHLDPIELDSRESQSSIRFWNTNITLMLNNLLLLLKPLYFLCSPHVNVVSTISHPDYLWWPLRPGLVASRSMVWSGRHNISAFKCSRKVHKLFQLSSRENGYLGQSTQLKIFIWTPFNFVYGYRFIVLHLSTILHVLNCYVKSFSSGSTMVSLTGALRLPLLSIQRSNNLVILPFFV